MRKDISIVSEAIAMLCAIALSSNAWDVAHGFPNPSFDPTGLTPVGVGVACVMMAAMLVSIGSWFFAHEA